MINVYIGWDAREAVASDVCAYSILKRTESNVNITFLKHRELRQSGIFARPWLTEATTGNWRDLIDDKPFSTEFSHTRFLVPSLMKFKGWALFMDSDMIFLNDIQKLFNLCNPEFAVMCVKHNHKPPASAIKMDGRQQLSYFRKNWSSFVLFNCEHPSNRFLTEDKVNFMKGVDLHSFSWLKDHEIGSIPHTYNYIVGVSPKLPPESGSRPAVIHYTEGGPWFEECKDVPMGDYWMDEYEDWHRNGHDYVCNVPTVKYDREDNV